MRKSFNLVKRAAKWYVKKMGENPYLPTGTVWVRNY